MSLPACQQRALDRIDGALRACEPRMAARFAVFARLTSGEDFPPAEQVERRNRRLWRRLTHGLSPAGRDPDGSACGRAAGSRPARA